MDKMSRSINKTFAVVLSLLISSVVLSQEKNTIQKQMSTLTITETSEPTTEELVVTSDYRSVSYEWIERSDNTATNQESLKNYYRSDFNWFIITLAAMYGGYELMKRGYVVLGRDIMVGAPLTYLTRRQIVRYQRSWGPLSQLQVWVSYEDDLGQEKYKMTAGDKGEIVCRITNPGPKRVKGIKPTIEPEGDYHLLQSLVVGQIQTTHRKSRFGNFRLNSGESMEIRLPISIPKTVPESNLKIVADISLVPNKSRNFRIENFNPPNIVLKVLDFDDQDRNHVLEGLEKGRLRIIVRNEGMGPARNIQLNLLSGDRNISIDPNNRMVVELNSGEERILTFDLQASRQIGDGLAIISIEAKERSGYDAQMLFEVSTGKVMPPDLVMNVVHLSDEDGNEILEGLEKGELKISIRNEGKEAATNIHVKLVSSDKNIKIEPKGYDIKKLMYQREQSLSFDLSASNRTKDGTTTLRLEASEARGYDARTIQLSVETRKLIPPEIFVDYWNINDGTTSQADGNDNKIIENGEQVEIKFEVTNSGAGPAYDCKVSLRLDGGIMGPLLLSRKEVSLGLIAPGATVPATFALNVPVTYDKNSIDVTVLVNDSRGSVDYSKNVQLESYYRNPELDFDYVIYDGNSEGSKGNANGIIEQGEIIELEILPQNRGEFVAEDVYLTVKIDYPRIDFETSEKSIGRIQPKTMANPVRFPFTVLRSAKPGSFDVVITMDQSVFSGLNKTLRLDLEEETVEMVTFGRREAAGFGRFGYEDGTIKINVDVAPFVGKVHKNAVAVVIGNRNYKNKDVPMVDYAERDARIMKSYLTRTFGFKESNILYVIDATVADFRRIFGTEGSPKGELFSKVRSPKTKVFVFYSGHGTPDLDEGEGYFVPSDAEPRFIKATGYPVNLMFKNLAQLSSKEVTVVIDACFSGTSEKGMLLKGLSPILLDVKESFISRGINNFTSSTGTQVSSWYPESRHGIFTYYFFAGLQGLADVNDDGKVTNGEMYVYLSEMVPDKVIELHGSEREQTPTFGGDPDKILVDLRK